MNFMKIQQVWNTSFPHIPFFSEVYISCHIKYVYIFFFSFYHFEFIAVPGALPLILAGETNTSINDGK